MSDRGTLQIQQISAHPGPSVRPGEGTQRQDDVCKLIDTTTCIGCKACEVACVEWNDMPFQTTTFDNTYQTMPDTRLELLEPHQVQRAPARRRHLHVADAQGPVHALRRSRMLARLSRRRRHRAIHQRHRRLPAGELHRLPVLRLRLSVQHSEVQPEHEEGLQVHAVLRPRRSKAWSPPASRRVRPAACTSARKTT